jgi:cobalamin biosynthesis Mg chelatase CobN
LKPVTEYGSVIVMNATEILDELPKLNPAELESIFRRAVELHQEQTVEASPELLAAIDEADEVYAKEGGVSVEEARRIVTSWSTK